MKSFTVLLSLLSAATYVSAHGHVHKIIIAGKEYLGNAPAARATPSVVRQISKADPIKGADSPHLNCGFDAKPGALVADAQPGDEVAFDWLSGELTPWPHNIGPMMTYMASCGNVTCDKYDPKDAEWFKIDEAGRKASDPSQWEQQDLFDDKTVSVKIPATLAPGNYLIRHEIIALHLAETLRGAEFYASCSQLRVGGTQTGVPRAEDLVKLPGAYKDTDAGILVNVFNRDASGGFPKYVYPGPAVAKLVSGGAGANNDTGSAPVPASKQTSGGCLKKRAAYAEQRPRVISHVMRRAPFAAHHP